MKTIARMFAVSITCVAVGCSDAGGLIIVEHLDAGAEDECDVDAAPNVLDSDAEAMQSPCAP